MARDEGEVGVPSEVDGTVRFQVGVHPAAEREFSTFDAKTRARFYPAFKALESDSFIARPGCDVKKISHPGGGLGLYRLRVGRDRACYCVITQDHKVWILLFESRRTGYKRMIRTASKRHPGRAP